MLIAGKKREIKTDVDLIRVIIEEAMWNVGYHEQALLKAAKKRAAAQALLARCDCDFTVEEAAEFYEDEDTHEDELKSVEDYLKYNIGWLASGTGHHQYELESAYEILEVGKILLARGKFSETEVSLAEIKAIVDERLAK